MGTEFYVVQYAIEKKDESLLKVCCMKYKIKQDREKKKRAEEDQAGDKKQQTREEGIATTQLLDSEKISRQYLPKSSCYQARVNKKRGREEGKVGVKLFLWWVIIYTK